MTPQYALLLHGLCSNCLLSIISLLVAVGSPGSIATLQSIPNLYLALAIHRCFCALYEPTALAHILQSNLHPLSLPSSLPILAPQIRLFHSFSLAIFQSLLANATGFCEDRHLVATCRIIDHTHLRHFLLHSSCPLPPNCLKYIVAVTCSAHHHFHLFPGTYLCRASNSPP